MAEVTLPLFKLNRTLTHISRDTGLSIHFEKGVVRPVHVILIKEVLALGAERMDDEQGAGLAEDDGPIVGEPTGPEREELIFAAFDELVERNDSKDFAASGMPKANAMKRSLGFTLDTPELTRTWMLFQARKSSEA